MTNDELDRLCAEKILEWTWDDRYFDTEGSERHPEGGYHPTRNIAQAWELLEKSGLEWEFSYQPGEEPKYKYALYFREPMIRAFADTAPLAIVHACLKAKGVKVE